MRIFYNYLIFPGFLFSVIIGLMAGWVDRKVTARIQWRVGPPWYQNFIDIIKLFVKETIVPQGAKATFLLSPYMGLLGSVLAATILGLNIMPASGGFNVDLIVVLYLLILPAIALIIGAASSGNPFASLAASREMKLVLGYELPFMLAVMTVIIKSAGATQLGLILEHQAEHGSNIASLSGALAFLAIIFCAQAKLCFVPFDASEAEQEIMAGALVEYSGAALAIFKLTRALLVYIMPLFLITLFMGKDTSVLFLTLKYLLILVIAILIKNTNPRLRVGQSLRFFLGPVTVIAAAAVILALIGK